MPAWSTITLADLYAAKASAIVDAARGVSLAPGEADPVTAAIADALSRIQTAIRTGNALDQDRTLIPNELRELAVRLIVRRLKGRVEMDLTPAEQQDQRDDLSYLNRIMDNRVRFDPAPNPDPGTVQAASPTPAISRPHRRFTLRTEDGL